MHVQITNSKKTKPDNAGNVMEGTQKCLAGPKKWRLKSEQQTSTEKSADSIFWWHILTLLAKSQRALKKHVKNWTIGMHPKTKPKKKQQQQQGLSQTQGLNPRTLTTKFNSNKHGATSSFTD